MRKRVPASQRALEALRDLIEGRLVSADARTELIKLKPPRFGMCWLAAMNDQ